MNKVYHVEFKEPINGQTHFFFGSQSAIYELLTAEQIGMSYNSLQNNYNLKLAPYENKKCTIRLGELIRKKTNRGIKSSTNK